MTSRWADTSAHRHDRISLFSEREQMKNGRFAMPHFALVGALCAVAHSGANAEVVHLSHEGRGSGTLNGVAFPMSVFVISAIADTNARQSFAKGFFIRHESAFVSIEGLGDFEFLSPTRTFVNNSDSIVGFSRGSGADLFDGPTDSQLATWDMLTSIGPVSGSGWLGQWGVSFADVETTGGVLRFDDLEDTSATFAAMVPPPSTLGLSGLVLTGVNHRRRKFAGR